MTALFRPKHQKIILQCYPSPSLPLAETLPNAAEVSSLVYYASTRRTKLDKVGTFLTKKTVGDVAHKRMGHIAVTLHILDQLLRSCPEDVGLLSPYVLAILHSVLGLRELSSHQAALGVFVTYCCTVQGAQSAAFGDARILSQFRQLALQLYACNGATNANSPEWALIPVRAARAVCESIDPTVLHFVGGPSKSSKSLITEGVTVLLHTIHRSPLDLGLVKLASAGGNSPSQGVADEALDTLGGFFNTSSKSQMDAANTAIACFALANNVDLRWTCHLMAITTRRSHIELRYRVVGLLLLLLDGSRKLEIDMAPQASQSYLANVVAYLLGLEDLQFFAVPVNDIIAKLVSLDARLLNEHSTDFSADLLDCYGEIVRNLSHRIYYNDQINEIIGQLCEGYATVVGETNVSQKGALQRIVDFTNAVVGHVNDVLAISKEPSISVKLSPMSKDAFKRVYYAMERIFDELAEHSSQTNGFTPQLFVSKVAVKWLKVINTYNTHFADPNWSHLNYNLSATSTNENVLCFYIEAITRVLVHAHEAQDYESCGVVLHTTKSFAQCTNGNFLVNWWKFAKSWLANGEVLYVMSLLVMHISGYTAVVELAERGLSAIDVPSWATAVYSNDSPITPAPPITYTQVTDTLLSVPELANIMAELVQGPTETSPVLDYGKPTPHGMILSETNSVRSWRETPVGALGAQGPSGTLNSLGAISREIPSLRRQTPADRTLSITSAVLSHRIGYTPSRTSSSMLDIPQPIALTIDSSRASMRSTADSVRVNLGELRQTTLLANASSGSNGSNGSNVANGASRTNNEASAPAKISPPTSGLAFTLNALSLETDDTL